LRARTLRKRTLRVATIEAWRAIACNGRRHLWHSWHLWQVRVCNLLTALGLPRFKPHPLRPLSSITYKDQRAIPYSCWVPFLLLSPVLGVRQRKNFSVVTMSQRP